MRPASTEGLTNRKSRISGEDYSQSMRSVSRDLRMSRNSTGAKEEFKAPQEGDLLAEKEEIVLHGKDPRQLAIYFVLMVFVGLGNKIFNKLETIPMHNYPNFLNLLTTAVYVPVTFAYIIPAARSGLIPKEQLEMPYKPFAVMGGLDAMAGIMQVFAATYLPGPLIILLSQSAIPISMIISKYMLNAKYNRYQYLGAVVVAAGILVVLLPTMTGSASPQWAVVMILSCVPMTLSSVYKEIALGEVELDAMYLNGMIAVFQLLFSLVLCVPSSLVSDPPVPIPELPQNLYNGLKCFVGISSKNCHGDDDDDCYEDECFPNAPLFVSLYLIFNQGYNLLILLILKFGSANILWMAMTLMVPLGNVAFTLPFVPENSPLRITDILGLIIICGGLGCYRFAADAIAAYRARQEDNGSVKEPLLHILQEADNVISSTEDPASDL